ncbi:MAG: nucleotidyltransferase domain-containing protein [Candidatus Aenigmarchaeota archaeon]|nr:nucleotidyltransferase domain-containing protein [Candidatus Aenigmarchaeota archaeon]
MLLNDARVLIFEDFVRNYSVQLTGSYIARKKKLNQKSVANVLKEFERDGFLKSTIEGKNKLYSLNLDDTQMAVHFICVLEQMRTVNFYKKNVFIKEIVSKILPYFKGIVIIFGSYAKGIAKKDSDLDVFVAGKYDGDSIEKVSKIYKLDINVKNYPEALFRKALSRRDPFIEEIMSGHIIVKNTQDFVLSARRFRYGND